MTPGGFQPLHSHTRTLTGEHARQLRWFWWKGEMEAPRSGVGRPVGVRGKGRPGEGLGGGLGTQGAPTHAAIGGGVTTDPVGAHLREGPCGIHRCAIRGGIE